MTVFSYKNKSVTFLVLAPDGKNSSVYHFRFNSKGATLIAISDSYGNRLHVTRDIHGRIKRLDNGAGRALLLRYDRKHIIAVDYQQFLPADNLEDAWNTVQTLVTYSYDAQHRLIEAKNAAGEAERYRYNDQHVILERQLAGGATFLGVGERRQTVSLHPSLGQLLADGSALRLGR